MNGLQNGLMYSDTTIVNTPWVDFSNNSTITGWATLTTRNIYYKRIGSVCMVMYDLIGTSSGAGTPSFTLPFTSLSALTIYHTMFLTDHTTSLTGLGTLASNSNTLSFSRPGATYGLAFTTFSGTSTQVRIVRGQFFYDII